MFPAASVLLRARLTRRRVLGLGLGFGGLALALGGSGVLLVRDRPPAPGRAFLSVEECRLLEALAETWFPPGNVLGVDGGDAGVAAALDGFFARLLQREQRAFRGVLNAFEQWPRLSLASGRTFSQLPLEDRVEVVRAWEDSSIEARRQLMAGLRVFVGNAYFEHKAVQAAMGFRWGCPVPLPILPSP